MTYSVAWFDSEKFSEHINAQDHVESPERLDAIRRHLARTNLDSKLQLQIPTQVDIELLKKLHHPEHIETIHRATQQGRAQLDYDTGVCTESWEAALLAAGAVADAVEYVLAQPNRRAFCSPRPPGHHARPNQAMGFCLFNNIAVGAQHALGQAGISKVAILDWDVHHGNGTQDIFYERGDVFFASIHQYPLYPGTGKDSETGQGVGKGTTLNCLQAAGATDADYLRAWNETIRPALEGFQPDFLFISAGFDADARDPIGGLNITPSGFEALSRAVCEWSEQACLGRVVSALEGGYNIEALGEDVAVHVDTLFA
jgi:acetoin utilization deacetylase AcuC-like enzyme